MNKEKLKVIFVGMPDMALVCLSELLEKEFNIVAIVPPKKNHETYKYFKDFCAFRNLNLIDYENSCNDVEYIEKIKEKRNDSDITFKRTYEYSSQTYCL